MVVEFSFKFEMGTPHSKADVAEAVEQENEKLTEQLQAMQLKHQQELVDKDYVYIGDARMLLSGRTGAPRWH